MIGFGGVCRLRIKALTENMIWKKGNKTVQGYIYQKGSLSLLRQSATALLPLREQSIFLHAFRIKDGKDKSLIAQQIISVLKCRKSQTANQKNM